MWVHLMEYESMLAMAKMMMSMTKPIHVQGKIIIGDSGFCVQDGVLASHQAGVFFQAYIKNGRCGRKAFFENHQLGECETLMQSVDGIHFLIHCYGESNFVSKIMLTHGMLDECQEHKTWWKVDGHWQSFN